MHSDLRVLLQLLDSTGQVLAQTDEPPWSGNTTVLTWPGGLAVQDEHLLSLPAEIPDDDASLVLSLEQRNRDGYSWRLKLVDSDVTVAELGQVDLKLPQPSHQVSAGQLAGQVRLLGFDAPEPQQVRAGASLPLTLTWECLSPMNDDYTVFIHLAEVGTAPVAQADSEPLGGGYPTSFWDPGEYVMDTYVLDVPIGVTPGEYELLVGMYLLATGTRLSLEDSAGQFIGDAYSLGQVTVSSP
jgi:hypothetical protein